MEKEIKVPDYTLYCVKKTFFPEELKTFKTLDDAIKYKEIAKEKKKTLYSAYTLNFYNEYLDRNNVIEIIYSEDNSFIAAPFEEGYEFYLPETSEEAGKNVWEYDPSFNYIDSDYELLDDLDLIKEKRKTRKRCK